MQYRLQLFQNKMAILETVIAVSLAEYLQFFLQICFLRNGKYISDNYPYKRALLYGVKWIGGLKISVKHRTMSDENQQLSN